MAQLQLRPLGGFDLQAGPGQAVPIRLKSSWGYLACHPGQSHPRDKLATSPRRSSSRCSTAARAKRRERTWPARRCSEPEPDVTCSATVSSGVRADRRPRPRSSAPRWSLVRAPREVAWCSTPRTLQYSALDHRGRRIPPNPLPPDLATARVHRGVLEQKLQLDNTVADVTRQSIARAPEHGQHGRVVGQHVRREAANAVGCRILDGPSLEGAAEADALPFGIDHVGHVGQPGPRIEEIGATADDALGFGLADDGDECHLLLVADSAEMLCHLVGQRAELTEEAGPHVLGSEVEEQTLEGGRIAGPGRPDGHLAAVAQLRLSYLLDRIGSMTALCLASRWQ